MASDMRLVSAPSTSLRRITATWDQQLSHEQSAAGVLLELRPFTWPGA